MKDVSKLNKIILDSRESILNASCKDIKFSEPILSMGGQGIIYPRTITVIQGQKGVHKSRFTEILASSFISENLNQLPLNFKRYPLSRFNVLYIDTERSIRDQLPFAIQKIKTLAGFRKDELPSVLDSISLIKVPRTNRYEAINEYLTTYRKNLAKEEHSIIILDVLTDCVKSFNDVNDSMLLIDKLNEMISDHNVSFICVIHENPSSFGDSKARGHLGTEIINKASQVIQIGFHKTSKGINTNLIVAKFLHSRNSKRPEDIHLQYSNEIKSLILANKDYVEEQNNLKAQKANIDEVKAWLNTNLKCKTAKEVLLPQLIEHFNCKERTIEDRLSKLTEDKFLVKDKESRNIFYNLFTNCDDLPF